MNKFFFPTLMIGANLIGKKEDKKIVLTSIIQRISYDKVTKLTVPLCEDEEILHHLEQDNLPSLKMNIQVKMYCDTGANITAFRKMYPVSYAKCDPYQYPYDSLDRPKKASGKMVMKLARPSALQWRDGHATWGESDFSWSDCERSDKFEEISFIIGLHHRRDILHVDSAFKTKCHILLTDDKDILLRKDQLQSLLGLKIFNPNDELKELVEYIDRLYETLQVIPFTEQPTIKAL